MAGSLRPGSGRGILSVHGRSVARHGKQVINVAHVLGAVWCALFCGFPYVAARAQTEIPKTQPSASASGPSGRQSGVAEGAKSKPLKDGSANGSGELRGRLESPTVGSAVATAVRVAQRGARTVFELDLSRRVAVQAFALAAPPRVVIDVSDLEFALPAGVGQRGHGLVSAFRYGQFAPGRSRIVIDATTAVRVTRAEVVAGGTPQSARLLVEIEIGTADSIATPEPDQTGALASPIVEPALAAGVPAPSKGAFVIMIDAGHGGIDGGASGGAQVVEKDIVLAVARQLKAALDGRKRYDVRMTRDKDAFVSLDQRVALSEAAGAHLFISIHADSVGDASVAKTARGASIYTLSETASNQAAQRFAEKENAADAASGITSVEATEREQVSSILADLVKRETQNFSLEFKSLLLDRLRPAQMLGRDPSRAAAFKVLRQTKTPTVLIELGFLTHETDSQQMLTADWQKRIAGTIAVAVDSYAARRAAR
jgi:N-acetylmuramoyl-L-alanine amidase